MKSPRKKILFLILILSIAVSQYGCGKKGENGNPHPSDTGRSSPSSTSTPPVTPPSTPSPTKSVTKLPKNKIREIAEKTTVFIIGNDGKVAGSGVIIAQNSNTLYVLTATHVIGIPPSKAEDPYIVTTNDGDKFKINYDNYEKIVNKLSDTDLTVLTLESTSKEGQQNRITKLESSVSKDMPIYIFGYLPCSSSAKGETKKQKQLSKGKIDKVESNPQVDLDTGFRGYDLDYNNNTVQGMSGSPVFDMEGRVVGIHAKTKKEKGEYDSKNCQTLPLEPEPDYGDNLGTSIKIFFNLKSYWPRGLDSILSDAIPETSPSEPTATPTPSSTTSPEVNCGPFRSPGEVCPDDR